VSNRFFRCDRAIALLLCATLAEGCLPSGSPDGGGVTLTPPSHWRATDPSSRLVPGRPVAAWSGPENSVLVVYKTLPMPGGTAAQAAHALATRLENLPGLTVVVNRTETIGGETLGRIEVVGPGTGDQLAPSSVGVAVAPPGQSLVPTRQITIFIVRPAETIQLSWSLPESAHEKLAADVQATLESIRFTPGASSWQSYN
jgi:hypothetical protein